jgi:hypothetical protein
MESDMVSPLWEEATVIIHIPSDLGLRRFRLRLIFQKPTGFSIVFDRN